MTTAPVLIEAPVSRGRGIAPVVRRTVVTRDGVRLAVRDYPASDGVEHTVVLLHGFCLSQTSWNLQIRQLRRAYGDRVRVISYDHRGHGLSESAPVGTYTIKQLALDHADVVEATGVAGPTTLGGHSMGAMTVLEFMALPAAERLNPTGLVLVAGAAGRLCERGVGRLLSTPALGLLAEVIDRAPHRAAERAVRAVVRPLCESLGRFCGCGSDDRDTLASTAAEAIHRARVTTAAGFLASLKTFDQYRILGSISADTAVISGGLDALTPAAHARDLASGIAGARSVHVPGAGHMLLHEAADVVTSALAGTIHPHCGPFGSALTAAGVS